MWASSGKKADAKGGAQSPEERRRQLRQTAQTAIDDSRLKLNKQLQAARAVESSQYYYYGYILATMSATMAGCLSLGSRVPFLRSSASMIALAGGYFGGSFFHKAHVQFNMAGVANVIDQHVADMKKKSEGVQGAIADYDDHVKELQTMKRQILPLSAEAVAEKMEQMQKQNMTVDERANAIVEAYEKRKAAATAAGKR